MYSKGFRFKEADLGVFSSNSDEVAVKIKRNCRLLGLTRGDFSLIDLIYSILKLVGKSDVIVCTWSAGIKDANQVKWMKNNDLIDSFTIITDRSYKNRQKKYAVALSSLFGDENIRTSDVHAKFTLIKNEDWNICIRHSMNLNANKTCETFEIDDNKEICEFYMDFVHHIFKESERGFVANRWKTEPVINSFFNNESINNNDGLTFNFSES